MSGSTDTRNPVVEAIDALIDSLKAKLGELEGLREQAVRITADDDAPPAPVLSMKLPELAKKGKQPRKKDAEVQTEILGYIEKLGAGSIGTFMEHIRVGRPQIARCVDALEKSSQLVVIGKKGRGFIYGKPNGVVTKVPDDDLRPRLLAKLKTGPQSGYMLHNSVAAPSPDIDRTMNELIEDGKVSRDSIGRYVLA